MPMTRLKTYWGRLPWAFARLAILPTAKSCACSSSASIATIARCFLHHPTIWQSRRNRRHVAAGGAVHRRLIATRVDWLHPSIHIAPIRSARGFVAKAISWNCPLPSCPGWRLPAIGTFFAVSPEWSRGLVLNQMIGRPFLPRAPRHRPFGRNRRPAFQPNSRAANPTCASPMGKTHYFRGPIRQLQSSHRFVTLKEAAESLDTCAGLIARLDKPMTNHQNGSPI